MGGFLFNVINPQCWLVDPKSGAADISTHTGDDGKKKYYYDFFQEVLNEWRERSRFTCDVDSERI